MYRGPTRVVVHPGSRGVAAAAGRALAEVADGTLARLPVTLRFWDGSELSSADGAPVVVLRDPAALAHVLRAPTQIGLARAWVDGSLDVEGDLEAVLRVRGAFAGVRVSAADRARLLAAALHAVGARALRPPPIPPVEARLHGHRHWLARDRDAVRHHCEPRDHATRSPPAGG